MEAKQVGERRSGKVTKRQMREIGLKAIRTKTRGRRTITGYRETGKGRLRGFVPKGIHKVIINDSSKESMQTINENYRKLFRNIIKDKGIMDIIIREENIQKPEISGRLETKIKGYDRQGRLVIEFVKGQGGTLMEAKQVGERDLKRRMDVEKGLGYASPEQMYPNLSKNGYIKGYVGKGKIERIEIVQIFRGR